MKIDIIGKGISMIIIILTKEKVIIKGIILIIWAINIQKDKREVEAEAEVGKRTIVEIGEI